jgi:DNA-binding response OmpR family regulator
MTSARALLDMALSEAGFVVETAANGEDAIRLVREREFDAIVLDLTMPGVSGVDVLSAIREQDSPAELPVIIMSGRGDPPTIVRLLDAGANDYVVKPVNFALLIARLHAHLRSRMATAEPAPVADFRPGDLVADRYELRQLLGEGAFGSVFEAFDRVRACRVAVKALRAAHLASPTVCRRFELEGLSTLRVRHPNAIEVLEVAVSAQGIPYMAMELLRGHDLATELESLPPGQVLPPDRVSWIICQMCDALQAAHAAGVIHRDIKMDNVFLHQGAEGEVVKVVDFGVARLVRADPQLTRPDELGGTPIYMAPERLRGEAQDERVDTYSVGVVLYAMLTRCFPYAFDASDPLSVAHAVLTEAPQPIRRIRPDLPEDLERVVARALSKDPAQRPELEEIQEAVRLFAA